MKDNHNKIFPAISPAILNLKINKIIIKAKLDKNSSNQLLVWLSFVNGPSREHNYIHKLYI